MGAPATSEQTTTTPDGKTTTRSYDGLGRVIAIQNPDDTTTQATFDAASHTLTSSGASGTTSYAYDPLGRISSETQPAKPHGLGL